MVAMTVYPFSGSVFINKIFAMSQKSITNNMKRFNDFE